VRSEASPSAGTAAAVRAERGAVCGGRIPPALAAPLLAAVLAGSLHVAAADGVDALSAAETETLNWAFASRLGSGIYDVSGRTVQVYRIPFRFDVRSETEVGFGLAATLQVTFGFYDFRAQDVSESGLPDDLDTLGITPGFETRIPAARRWLLKPYVEAGYGYDRTGTADAWLYSAGTRSLATFDAGRFRLVLGHDLFWAHVDPEGGAGDDFAALQTAFEALRTVGRAGAHDVELGLYAVQDLSLAGSSSPFGGSGGTLEDRYEVGITVGTAEPARWHKVPLPRVGLGYRFGDDLGAARLVIGIPVASLRR